MSLKMDSHKNIQLQTLALERTFKNPNIPFNSHKEAFDSSQRVHLPYLPTLATIRKKMKKIDDIERCK